MHFQFWDVLGYYLFKDEILPFLFSSYGNYYTIIMFVFLLMFYITLLVIAFHFYVFWNRVFLRELHLIFELSTSIFWLTHFFCCALHCIFRNSASKFICYIIYIWIFLRFFLYVHAFLHWSLPSLNIISTYALGSFCGSLCSSVALEKIFKLLTLV